MKNQLNLLPYSVLAILLFLSVESIAQSPQKFSSQIVVRNASNELVSEDVVRVQVSILQGTPEGTVAYSEVHQPFTNVNGLASMEIGTGTDVTGLFSDIDWKLGPYFIKTEVDPTGGTNYTISGTTELLSVPYALYAGSDDDWIVDGNDIYVPPGTKVGIGIVPQASFHVAADNALIGGLTVGRGNFPSPFNSAFGRDALNSVNSLTWINNTAIGYSALVNLLYGFDNTAVGSSAFFTLENGSSNTAVGSGAGSSFDVGSSLTLIGNSATANNGLDNATALGADSEVTQSNSLILGAEGVLVGISVGGAPNEQLEVGGSGRAFFGNGAGANRKGLLIDGVNGDYVRLAAYDYGAGGPMKLGLSGDVGIHRNDPSVALDVLGSIEYTGTITDVSDERLKENFEPIDGAVESLALIQGYTYNMIDDTDTREYGVIAQDVQKVFPEMVTVVDEEEGYLGVSYVQLIPVLLEAIKELKLENELLQAENKKQTDLIKSNTQLMGELKAILSSSTQR